MTFVRHPLTLETLLFVPLGMVTFEFDEPPLKVRCHVPSPLVYLEPPEQVNSSTSIVKCVPILNTSSPDLLLLDMSLSAVFLGQLRDRLTTKEVSYLLWRTSVLILVVSSFLLRYSSLSGPLPRIRIIDLTFVEYCISCCLSSDPFLVELLLPFNTDLIFNDT